MTKATYPPPPLHFKGSAYVSMVGPVVIVPLLARLDGRCEVYGGLVAGLEGKGAGIEEHHRSGAFWAPPVLDLDVGLSLAPHKERHPEVMRMQPARGSRCVKNRPAGITPG